MVTNRHSQAQANTRYRVLRLLEESPDISQREIANRLNISLGGVNYSLKALVERGWVKIKNFKNSRNKLAYAYLLTPAGVAQKSALASHFLARKLKEYEALKVEIADLELELRSQKLTQTDDLQTKRNPNG